MGRLAPSWVVDRYRHWTTDAYIVSFPKSGRTWFRTILGTALQLRFGIRHVDPTSVHMMWMFDPDIPRLAFTHDVNAHLRPAGEVQWDGGRYRNKKTILLIRDPRDTIVSLYFEMSKRVGSYNGSISDFIRQDSGGLASLVAFLNSWAANISQLSQSLILTYEDLHQHPLHTIRSALEFIGVSDVEDRLIMQAIESCSFDVMRRMEQRGDVAHVRLRPGDVNDPQSYKVRNGKVGGYRTALPEADRQFVDRYVAEHLDESLSQYKQ